jgi:hypothetical protein
MSEVTASRVSQLATERSPAVEQSAPARSAESGQA